MRHLPICFVIALLLYAAAPISAYSADDCTNIIPYASYGDIPKPLLQRRYFDSSTQYEEYFVAKLLGTIRSGGESKQELTKNDVEKVREKFITTQRGMIIGRFLAADTNADSSISPEEFKNHIGSFTKPFNQSLREEDANLYEQLDADKNGTLTIAELSKIDGNLILSKPAVSLMSILTETLSLDPNDDGKLTIDELRSVALRTFRTIDKDKDGITSKDELDAFFKATTPE